VSISGPGVGRSRSVAPRPPAAPSRRSERVRRAQPTRRRYCLPGIGSRQAQVGTVAPEPPFGASPGTDTPGSACSRGCGQTALRRRHGGAGSCAFEDARVWMLSRTRCGAGDRHINHGRSMCDVERFETAPADRTGNRPGRASPIGRRPRHGCTYQLAPGTTSATRRMDQRRCCCTPPGARGKRRSRASLADWTTWLAGLRRVHGRARRLLGRRATTRGVTAVQGRSAARPRGSCAQSAA
jgi:hypothetical protein